MYNVPTCCAGAALVPKKPKNTKTEERMKGGSVRVEGEIIIEE
jgi:hypothetical protein